MGETSTRKTSTTVQATNASWPKATHVSRNPNLAASKTGKNRAPGSRADSNAFSCLQTRQIHVRDAPIEAIPDMPKNKYLGVKSLTNSRSR